MSSFLFIPDISGFSEFVQTTEIEHSNHIISELLELLIDNNQIDLELAEIEGDALFYYKYNTIPSFEELSAQVETMFIKFYQHLKLYEHQRICNCGACINTQNLKLKFVAHAGDFNFIQVKDQKKPFGDPVIEAHRLLKNNVDHNEYVLISDQLNEVYQVSDPTFVSGHYDYDIGRVQYKYKILESLKERIPAFDPKEANNDGTLLMDMEMNINQHILPLSDLLMDLDKRHQWNKAAKIENYEKKKVNRVSAKHICVVGNQKLDFETITKSGKKGQIVYGERIKDVGPLVTSVATFYILTPVDEHSTHLKIESFAESRNILQKLARPLLKSQLKKGLVAGLNNLKAIAEQS